MGDDEVIILLVGGGFAFYLAGLWYFRLGAPSLVPDSGRLRLLLGLAPLAGCIAVLATLMTLAAGDVRSAPIYVLLYALVGTAWIYGAGLTSAYVGVSARDDVIERRNPAAAIMIVAIILSQAAIYSGANVGNGPGWWVVLISGTMAATCWLAIWLVVNGAVQLQERITVDRDVPAAIRLGALMLAVGLICGRGAAGDWFSFNRTLEEFVVAWPAVALAVIAIAVERLLRGQKMAASLSLALLVGLTWLAGAGYAIATSPPLSRNPAYDLSSGADFGALARVVLDIGS